MKSPDANQLACLKRIASGRSGALNPCDAHMLALLLEAGYIERAPRIWLPIQPVRMIYRLTPLGESALHGC